MRRETTCKETEGQRFPEFSEHFNLQIQRDQQICSRINERQIKYNQVTVKLLKTKDKETVWKSARRNTLQQTRNQQHGCLHISRETEARGSGAACSSAGRQTNGQLRSLHVRQRDRSQRQWGGVFKCWKADERSAQTPTREQRDRGQRRWGCVFTVLEGRRTVSSDAYT